MFLLQRHLIYNHRIMCIRFFFTHATNSINHSSWSKVLYCWVGRKPNSHQRFTAKYNPSVDWCWVFQLNTGKFLSTSSSNDTTGGKLFMVYWENHTFLHGHVSQNDQPSMTLCQRHAEAAETQGGGECNVLPSNGQITDIQLHESTTAKKNREQFESCEITAHWWIFI